MTKPRIAIQKGGDGRIIALYFYFTVAIGVLNDIVFLPPLREEGEDWKRLSEEAQRVIRALIGADGVDGISSVVITNHRTMCAYKVSERRFNINTMADAVKAAMEKLFEDAVVTVFQI